MLSYSIFDAVDSLLNMLSQLFLSVLAPEKARASRMVLFVRSTYLFPLGIHLISLLCIYSFNFLEVKPVLASVHKKNNK